MCTPAPLHYNEALFFDEDQKKGKSSFFEWMVKATLQKQAFLFHFNKLIYARYCEALFPLVSKG